MRLEAIFHNAILTSQNILHFPNRCTCYFQSIAHYSHVLENIKSWHYEYRLTIFYDTEVNYSKYLRLCQRV